MLQKYSGLRSLEYVEGAEQATAMASSILVTFYYDNFERPLADGSLTKAYSVAVLCHMDKEDLFLYLKELHRTVRPGGLIYVETWNLAHPIGWKRWEYEVANWRRSEQKQHKDVARNQFCTPDEFELYVRRVGFAPLACHSDSPWVQVVAGHSLDDAEIARQHRRLSEETAVIAYSPLFGRLFEMTVDVIYGVIHPRELMAFLDDHAEQHLVADNDAHHVAAVFIGNLDEIGRASCRERV